MLLQIIRVLHLLGLVVGGSGATTMVFFVRKSILKGQVTLDILKMGVTALNITWVGVGVIVISDVALLIMNGQPPLDWYLFGLKFILIAVMVGITAYIELCLYKEIKESDGVSISKRLVSLCKKNGWLCWILIILWYSIVILSVYYYGG